MRISDWSSDVCSSDLAEIGARLWVSLEIAVLAMLLAVTIAFPLGTLAALYRGTTFDYVIRIVTIAGLAVPSFWLGMLIVMALLAGTGRLPPLGTVSLFEDPLTNLYQLFWPEIGRAHV